MSWRDTLMINNKAVSVHTMILKSICSLLEQWDNSLFKLFNKLNEDLSVGATNINRRLTIERYTKRLIIGTVLLPTAIAVVQLLEDLTEECKLSCVVNFT